MGEGSSPDRHRNGHGGGEREKDAGAGIGEVVARHYDNLPEKGRESRQDSRIYHMRFGILAGTPLPPPSFQELQ